MSSKIRRILVPVDNSEGSCRAAALAAELAEATGASLTLLHIVDRDSITLLGVEALSPKEFDRAVEKFTKQAFEAAMKGLGNRKPATEFRLGKPSMEIVRFAEEQDMDLIVMGSRGLSRFKELMIGSVSSQVAHHAPCSVTIVR